MVLRTNASGCSDSASPITGSPFGDIAKEVTIVRAEEGDESIDELADEAAKTKKELRESTETGQKVQEGSADHKPEH
jgi:hypothetical protein